MEQVTSQGTIRLLLTASRQRQARHTARWTIGIAALGLANLLMCAWLERFVTDWPDGEGLLLLAAVEAAFLLFAASAVFAGELEAILQQSLLLPVHRGDRHLFLLLAVIRHPAIVVVLLTALLAAALIGPAGAVSAFTRVGFMSLLSAAMLTSITAVFTLRARGGAGGRFTLALTAGAGVVVVIAAAVVSPGPVLLAIPPLRWALEGTLAADQGAMGRAGLRALLLAAWSALAIAAGRRHA